VTQGKNARAWLAGEGGVPEGKIGLIGFCFGGGYALMSGAGWGAVSTNYGMVPDARVMRGIGPVIGCYGKRDKQFPDGRRLTARLGEVGVTPEVHVFDAGHSFLTDGDIRLRRILFPRLGMGHFPEAREEAWEKIFAFFDRHLS
jgi:carboxymethylenebutenolidase